MDDLIRRSDVQTILATALSKYITDETREILEQIDMTIGDMPPACNKEMSLIQLKEYIDLRLMVLTDDNSERSYGRYIAYLDILRVINDYLYYVVGSEQKKEENK